MNVKDITALNQLIEDCPYTFEDIDAIVTSTKKTWTDERKVDTLLWIDATLCSQEGCNSTKKDIAVLKSKQKALYRGIKQVDKALGETLLRYAR